MAVMCDVVFVVVCVRYVVVDFGDDFFKSNYIYILYTYILYACCFFFCSVLYHEYIR